MRQRLAVTAILVTLWQTGCSDAFDTSSGGTGTPAAGASGAGGGAAGGTAGSAGKSAAGAGGSGAGGAGGAAGVAGAAGVGGVAGKGGSSGTAGAAAGAAGAAGKGGGGGAGGGCAIGFQCMGDALQSCDLATGKYATVQVCKAGLCDAKLGQCDDCKAGEAVSCADAQTVQTCGTNGKPGTKVACPLAKPDCIGKGQCVECTMASQCPQSTKECVVPTCASNTCGVSPVTAMTPAKTQTPNSCTKNVCDGNGGVVAIADPTNLPVDKGDPCVKPACNGSTPTTTPSSAGTPCNGGAGQCNGLGACAECVPGVSVCVGNSVKTCDPTGHWGATAACSSPNPVCSEPTKGAGACVSVTQVTGNQSQTFGSPGSTCALLSDGTVRCWGENMAGQLGLGATSTPKLTPQVVPSLTGIKKVSSHGDFACAIKASDGSLWCWGANYSGMVGNGMTGVALPQPKQVPGLAGVVDVAVGSAHACAVTASETYCWGANTSGQLGNGGMDSPNPVLVPGVVATALSAGAAHTCALIAGGQVSCWGKNDLGQLGSNSTAASLPMPQTVVLDNGGSAGAPLANAVSLTTGTDMTCAQTVDTTYCWGNLSLDVIGAGTFVGSPPDGKRASAIAALAGWSSLSLGVVTCGIAKSGIAECTGAINAEGELGIGSTVDGNGYPEIVTTLTSSVSAIAVCGRHGCAIDGGQLYCWGMNSAGEVGVGTTMNVLAPTAVLW